MTEQRWLREGFVFRIDPDFCVVYHCFSSRRGGTMIPKRHAARLRGTGVGVHLREEAAR